MPTVAQRDVPAGVTVARRLFRSRGAQVYWLTAIVLLAVFFLWAFSPDVAGALWATVATLAACWLAIDLFE